MHNTESVLENEIRQILLDFYIQTDPLISPRWPDLHIVNKKKENLSNSGKRRKVRSQSKTERKQKER